MHLRDFLDPESVTAHLDARTKREALRELASLLGKQTGLAPERLSKELEDREELGTTAVGEAVAIPHCRERDIKGIALCMARSEGGVDFGAPDGQPVRLFVAMVSPRDSRGLHLQVLSRISSLLRAAPLREALKRAHTAHELHTLLLEADALREEAVARVIRPEGRR